MQNYHIIILHFNFYSNKLTWLKSETDPFFNFNGTAAIHFCTHGILTILKFNKKVNI